jgi:hypothetical protein
MTPGVMLASLPGKIHLSLFVQIISDEENSFFLIFTDIVAKLAKLLVPNKIFQSNLRFLQVYVWPT